MRPLVLPLFLLVCLLVATVDAKKEKPLHVPFPKEVINAIRCDVCRIMVRKGYRDVKLLFVGGIERRVPMTEDDVLTAMEDICNPFAEAGQWIRKVAVDCAEDGDPFRLRARELPTHTKCKRACTTVEEACEAIIDHESMDQLSAKLLRPNDYADEEVFAHEVCDASPLCVESLDIPLKRQKDLRAMIKADAMEVIDAKEMEVERMMDQMERKENRRHEVFTRDEIISMQQSILDGDRESVAQVDPSIMQLSDEEFSALRAMLSGKETDPRPEDNEASEGTQSLHDDDEL